MTKRVFSIQKGNMALLKQTIEKLNGNIKILNDFGSGIKFIFSIPLKQKPINLIFTYIII